MSDIPNDEANLKYELALILLAEQSDRPPNMEQTRRKWKMEAKLEDMQTTRLLMEAVYEEEE